MMKITERFRGARRYWLIVAVVVSLFSVDFIYVKALRSLFSYGIQVQIGKWIDILLVIAGFSWSQAFAVARTKLKESSVLKIVAPLEYKKGKQELVGLQIIATHDLNNPRIDIHDVHEELLVARRGKHPKAILIQRVTPPKQPRQYRPRDPEW